MMMTANPSTRPAPAVLQEIAQALKIAAPEWTDAAALHVASKIFSGFVDCYSTKVANERLERLRSDIEIANAETVEDLGEFDGLAQAYRAEDEAASRRPGAARLSSTLRSEVGYEDDRR